MASSTEVKSHHSMSSRGRFELPVLGPLDSLTNGTNIPPPLESPVKEIPPPIIPSKVDPEDVSAAADSATTYGHTNGRLAVVTEHNGENGANGNLSASSPSSERRPGSIRRFLSRNSMYLNYTESRTSQENLSIRAETPTSERPPNKKRRSSWFARFTGNGLGEPTKNKRGSVVYEEKITPVPMGPPPPKLPELNQLKARIEETDEGSLGGEDLFKNIK